MAAAAQAKTDIVPNAAAPIRRTMSLEQAEALLPRFSSVEQLKLVTRFIHAARYDEAETLLQRVRPATARDRLYYQYLVALITFGKGQPEEAVARLRKIVQTAPRFTRARLTLAKILYELKQDQAAKYHFELLQGEAASRPGLAGELASFIDSIDRRKPFTYSGYFTIAPSTNVNNGTNRRTIIVNGLPFQIDDDSREKSGIGLGVGGQAAYRYAVNDKLDILTTAVVDARFYRDKDFNVLTGSLSTGPKLYFNWGSVGAFVVGSLGYSANIHHNTAGGGLLTLQARMSPRDILSASAQCMNRYYSDDFDDSDLSYRDGYTCFANGRLEHFFGGTRAARLVGGLGVEKAKAEHLKNTYWSIGAGMFRDIPFGFIADLQFKYSRRNYDGIAPGATFGRADDQMRVDVQLLKPSWNYKGFAPQLNYSYTHNNSNVNFNDYDSQTVSLTFSKRF